MVVDTGINIYFCANISLFSSSQATSDASVLTGNRLRAFVHGAGIIDLKFTLGNIMRLYNKQHVPGINKNLVSGSLLC